MFCTKCGKEIKEGVKFCTSCGEKVSEVQPSEVQPRTPINYSDDSQTVDQNASKDKGIIVIIIVIIAAIIIACGVIAFFWFGGMDLFDSGSKNQNSKRNSTEIAEDIEAEETAVQASADGIMDSEPAAEEIFAAPEPAPAEEVPAAESPAPAAEAAAPEENNTGKIDSGSLTGRVKERSDSADNEEEHAAEEYDPASEYILPDSDTCRLTQRDLWGFSADECRLARNEIYARHGRRFDSEDLQNYFDSCSWYYGYIEPNDFKESMLSELEMYNRDLIVAYEEEMGYR